MNITMPKARNILHLHLCTPPPPIQCFTDASQFVMISLLSPGVILFIFIIWLMMPPADIKTVGSRITSTDQKTHSHTWLAGLKARKGVNALSLELLLWNIKNFWYVLEHRIWSFLSVQAIYLHFKWNSALRGVKKRLILMNGPIKLMVMELIEVCFQRNTVTVIHGKVKERKGLAPSLSSSASFSRD